MNATFHLQTSFSKNSQHVNSHTWQRITSTLESDYAPRTTFCFFRKVVWKSKSQNTSDSANASGWKISRSHSFVNTRINYRSWKLRQRRFPPLDSYNKFARREIQSSMRKILKTFEWRNLILCFSLSSLLENIFHNKTSFYQVEPSVLEINSYSKCKKLPCPCSFRNLFGFSKLNRSWFSRSHILLSVHVSYLIEIFF